VLKVGDKIYVGKNIIHVNIFKKNDKRTIYNAVYRDGKEGPFYIKRFAVNGVTREKEYDLTQGNPNSRVMYFSANPNGEAEVIRVTLKPKLRLRNLTVDKDFSEIAIKGRQSMGNVLTKNDIHKIALKQKGGSTLGGRKVYFDHDVLRLNYDNRGQYLGEFQSDDLILVVTKKGEFYTCNFDLTNHFEDDILRIEKFDNNKVWSAALFDAEQKFHYIKRFQFEPSSKRASFLGENPDSQLKVMSDHVYPRFRVEFGGGDSFREAQVIDVEEFIGVKSYKAKGKRISNWEVERIEELEPTRFPEPEDEPEPNEEESETGESPSDGNDDSENGSWNDDSGTQMSLF
jgi:topoisomerase-4 subunit A